jgi:hypothetical protein
LLRIKFLQRIDFGSDCIFVNQQRRHFVPTLVLGGAQLRCKFGGALQ